MERCMWRICSSGLMLSSSLISRDDSRRPFRFASLAGLSPHSRALSPRRIDRIYLNILQRSGYWVDSTANWPEPNEVAPALGPTDRYCD